MLTEIQIGEIREHLEQAQNPVFYYDNDADGLCSYVLLQKFIGRGRGVAVRSFPDLNSSYARKAQELNADYVFVLDKPALSKEFVEEVSKLGLPLVWIDHHEVSPEEWEKGFENLFVYNPTRNLGDDKSSEPTTYLSYKISRRAEDIWLGVVGCVADHYLPDFAEKFAEKFPDLWGKVSSPSDAYFGTEIGKVAMALNFGLKDSITNVVKLQNFLISAKSPEDVFDESLGNYAFRRRYQEVRKKYDYLMQKARNCVSGNLVFFEYSGELSISSEVANGLSHEFSGKYVVVAYKKGDITNLSLRGKNVRAILSRIFEKMEGNGGGHEEAVGARIATKDLDSFREFLEGEIENGKD